jgi:hypothetical protein
MSRLDGGMHFDLSFERREVYECGALLLTVLACPKDADKDRSVQLYRSLCGKALWHKHAANPDDWTQITVKPQYVFRDRTTIDRDVNFVEKRLGERMVAGRMAIPFFQQASLGRPPPLPPEIKRLSINQMAEFVLDDAAQAEAGNVEQRFWLPSGPVIHLAAAAAIVGQQLRKGGQIVGLETFLTDGTFIEEVVGLAGTLEALIANDPKFPVPSKVLIRFRVS